MSLAALPSTGLRRKLRQVEEGAPRLRTMYFATIAWLTSMPSLSSSPWIRGAPQSGTVPLDHRCWLDQHHHLQPAWPQSVEQAPEQAVDREQPQPTRPLAAKNVQL